MSGQRFQGRGRDYLLLFMQAKVASEKVGATINKLAENESDRLVGDCGFAAFGAEWLCLSENN